MAELCCLPDQKKFKPLSKHFSSLQNFTTKHVTIQESLRKFFYNFLKSLEPLIIIQTNKYKKLNNSSSTNVWIYTHQTRYKDFSSVSNLEKRSTNKAAIKHTKLQCVWYIGKHFFKLQFSISLRKIKLEKKSGKKKCAERHLKVSVEGKAGKVKRVFVVEFSVHNWENLTNV